MRNTLLKSVQMELWNELPTVKMYVEVIPQTKVIQLGFKLPVQVKWNLDGDHNICFWIKTGALAWLRVFLIKKEGFSTESPLYATNEPLASLFWVYDKKLSLIISCYCTVCMFLHLANIKPHKGLSFISWPNYCEITFVGFCIFVKLWKCN